MHLDPMMPLLAGAALVIVALGLAMRSLRQPHVVIYLIAGVVLGAPGLGWLDDQQALARAGAIGVDLLLFFVGMEVSPQRLIANWRVMLIGTAIQIAASVVCVLLVGNGLGWALERSVLLGFVISLSSTAVVIKMLEDWGELQAGVGEKVVAIILAQDLALVPMLIAISMMRGEGLDAATLGPQVGGGLAVLALLGWIATREQIRLPLGARLRSDHELQVFAALVICFGLAFLTGLAGLSTALGAFVGGIVVGAARETTWVHESLAPFRVVLVALFFVSVGAMVDLDFLFAHALQVGLLLLAVIATNTLINAGILRAFDLSWRDSFYGGALLSQIGEFSFVLAAVAWQAGIVTAFVHKTTVLVVALSLMCSPAWIGLMRRAQGRGEPTPRPTRA